MIEIKNLNKKFNDKTISFADCFFFCLITNRMNFLTL